MIEKTFTYAIIGASNHEDKYGYKVFKDLLDAGYKVIPIHPSETEILWEKVFPTLSDYEEKVDVVIFVVPPEVTEMILTEVKMLWIEKVWMQPGSESDRGIAYCEANGIECVHDACIMIQKG